MYLEEIGLRPQNRLISIIISLINVFWGTNMTTSYAQAFFTLTMNKRFIGVLEITRKVA